MKPTAILSCISRMRPGIWTEIPIGPEDEYALNQTLEQWRSLSRENWLLLRDYVQAMEGKRQQGTGKPIIPPVRRWFIAELDRYLCDALLWRGKRAAKKREDEERRREHPHPVPAKSREEVGEDFQAMMKAEIAKFKEMHR